MGYVIHHVVVLSCDPLSALEPPEMVVHCPVHDPPDTDPERTDA